MSENTVRYTLVSPSGQIKSGRVKAHELESILSLANEGYEILELEEEKPKKIDSVPAALSKAVRRAKQREASKSTAEVRKPKRPAGRRISTEDLKFFTLHLSELLRAGVNLLEALTAISDNDDGPLGELAHQLGIDIQSGHNLSGAMFRSPFHFDETFIGMVRIGEESGRLGNVLAQLNHRVAKSEELRRGFIQASIYPMALLLASFMLLAFVGMFVVPSILPIIENLSDDIPWPTKVLLVINDHSWKIFLSALALFACIPWLKSSNPVAVSMRQWLKYESPLFGALARSQALNQFCHDFGLLLDSGVSVVKALGFIRFDDIQLEEAKRRIIENIINGASLAEAFEDEPRFPRLMSVLLLVAEESGANLATILQHQSELLEFEAEENRQALSRLFEPILISIMGLIVGFVLVAVFLPIYSQLASNL